MSEKDSSKTDAVSAAILVSTLPAVADIDVPQKPKLTNISTSPTSLSKIVKARSHFVLPASVDNVARSTSYFRIPKSSPTPTASPFSRQSDSISETSSIKSVKSTVSFKIEKVEEVTTRQSSTDIVVDDVSEYEGSLDARSLKSEDFEANEDVFIMEDIRTSPKKCRLKEIAGQRPAFRRVDSSDSIPPPNEYKNQHIHHGADDVDPYNLEVIDDNNDKVIITVEGKYFT